MPAVALSLLCAAGLGVAGWRDLSAGLPPSDDIATWRITHTGEVWIGTVGGVVWRSKDGGQSYLQVFNVPAAEPIVMPQLFNIRESSVPDLGRGTNRDIDPRDRRARAQQEADLSGEVSQNPRDRSTPLLSALVRPQARDLLNIEQIEICERYVYIVTQNGAFRSAIGADLFVPLPLGLTENIDWMSCDPTQAGRLIAMADGRIHESLNDGDTFFPYTNPLPRSESVEFADFDDDGRLLILFERKVYHENAGRHGYQRVCELQGDSVESEDIRWAWWSESGEVFGVTPDGVTLCGRGSVRRLPDMRLAKQDISYLWIDYDDDMHILIASKLSVFESFDGGMTMREIFVSPTTRSIQRVTLGLNSQDIWIATGGQIYRRISGPPTHDFDAARAQAALEAAVPLGEVLRKSLGRMELLPAQLAQKRASVRWRALMPRVVVHFSRHEIGDDNQVNQNLPAPLLPVIDQNRNGDNIWTAFALWDLGDLIFEPLQADEIWADLEVLRRQLTYHVEDAYMSWLRASVALEDPAVPGLTRAHFELIRREAAAYLYEMSGHDVFAGPAS